MDEPKPIGDLRIMHPEERPDPPLSFREKVWRLVIAAVLFAIGVPIGLYAMALFDAR